MGSATSRAASESMTGRPRLNILLYPSFPSLATIMLCPLGSVKRFEMPNLRRRDADVAGQGAGSEEFGEKGREREGRVERTSTGTESDEQS